MQWCQIVWASALFFHKCCLTDKDSGCIPIFGHQKRLPSLVLPHFIGNMCNMGKTNEKRMQVFDL
jgi:hypothetical protein